jgi:hypothetical protein
VITPYPGRLAYGVTLLETAEWLIDTIMLRIRRPPLGLTYILAYGLAV